MISNYASERVSVIPGRPGGIEILLKGAFREGFPPRRPFSLPGLTVVAESAWLLCWLLDPHFFWLTPKADSKTGTVFLAGAASMG